MLSVLIVDDELSIRECLEYVINWEECGFNIIGTASNGIEALEKIKEKRPDLIITDIKMPIMGGLELIEKAHELYKNTKFIVLSGYDEIDFAKKAIKLKGNGYLLKPVEEDELNNLLREVKKDVEITKQNKTIYLRHIVQIMTAGLYTKDMYPQYDEEKMFRKQNKLYYISVEIDEEEDVFRMVKPSKEDKSLSEVIKHITEYIGYSYEFCIEKTGVSSCGILAWEDLLKNFGVNISSFVKAIQNRIEINLNKKVSVMAGKMVSNCYDIYLSKQSIELCKKHKFYTGSGSRLEYDKITRIPFCNYLEDSTSIEELVQATVKSSKQEIYDAVDKLCNKMQENSLSPDSLKIYINSLTMDFISEIDELGGNKETILLKFNLLNKVNNLDIFNVNEFLKKQCVETGKYITLLRKKRSSGIIGEIIDYICDNCDKDINLKRISEEYHFNTCYLGQLFKKKVGVNFNTFLLGVRISKAKKLLANTDLKIFEISDMVGFKDPNYFCVKFLESEKVSPSKYREENLIDNLRKED